MLPWFERWRRVADLVIHAHRGIDRLAHPVDHDIGEQLVFAETLFHVAPAVAPRTELLNHPAGQPDGRVVQPVGQGLRLGRMHHRIGALLRSPLLDGAEILLFGFREFRLVGGHSGIADIGEVDANEQIRVRKRQEPRDSAPNVPTRCSKTPVAEHFCHQPRPQLGGALRRHSALVRAVGEAIPWQRRHDHVEGVRGIAAMTRRIGEQWNDLVHTVERIRPAVGDDNRQRVRSLAALMDEVDAEAIDLDAKLGKVVEHRLLCPPIEVALPVVHQRLQIG